jgi:type I restriction enzyme M protein
MAEATIKNNAAFIWSVADLLRGDYKQSEYAKVILPLTVLRRLDCVLEPTKAAVLERTAQPKGRVDNIEPVLEGVTREQFFNTSKMDFKRLLDTSAPTRILTCTFALVIGTVREPRTPPPEG